MTLKACFSSDAFINATLRCP